MLLEPCHAHAPCTLLHAPSCRAKVDKLIRLLKPIKGCIKLCDHDVVCTSKVIEGFNEVRKVVSAWDGPKHVKDAASDAIEDRYDYMYFTVHSGLCCHLFQISVRACMP